MCENCPDEEMELIPLKFIGGRTVKGRRGPYISHETGKTYMMRPGYAELPWWEPVNPKDVKPKEEEIKSEYLDEVLKATPSRGLTKAFNQGGSVMDDDFIRGMDDAMLKHYIESNGGKIDGRWGRKSLIEAAKKLQ